MHRAVLPPLLYVMFIGWARTQRWQRNALWHRIHSTLLALYSGVIFVTIATQRRSEIFTVCAATRPLPAWICVSWYLSKLWEWMDTVLLIARRKQISRLHFLHHMITPSIVAVQQIGVASHAPLLVAGIATNSFAHVLMYSHYAHPWPVHARRWITRCQVGQHAFMLALILCTVVVSGDCVRDGTNNLLPLGSYLFFFAEFSRL